MNYDYSLKKDNIDYGFINGNNKIVFVKSGLGGSYLGYENKYLTMACQLREKYGCNVGLSDKTFILLADAPRRICTRMSALPPFLKPQLAINPARNNSKKAETPQWHFSFSVQKN